MKGIDWEKIDAMPSSRHHAIRAVAGLLGLALGYAGFIQPSLERLERAESRVMEWQARIAAREQESHGSDHEEQRLAAALRNLEALSGHFMHEGSMSLDLADLSRLAGQQRLHVLHLEPLPGNRVDWRIVHPLDLSLSGEFSGLARFLAGMGALPRLFVIESLELRPLQRDTVSMHLRLLFHEPADPLPGKDREQYTVAMHMGTAPVPEPLPRMPEPAEKLEILRNPFRDPALAHGHHADVPGLLEEMHLAAILRNRDNAWALVRMPDRQLRKVHVGELLDGDGHRIEAIHLRGLSLRATQEPEGSGTRPASLCWPRPDDC